MTKQDSLEALTNSAKCLIVFENKTASLYKDLAEKTGALPLVKSLLSQISLDSQKHSTLLKGLVRSLPKTVWETKELPKSIAEAWRSIDAFQIELSDADEMTEDDLSSLSIQLGALEGIMEEAFDILVQYDNLELISTELSKLYNVDIEALKMIFLEIIRDERRHKEILVTVRDFISRLEKTKVEAAPAVRFRNPDAWNRPAPSSVYC
jgi:hypothetical protein